MNPSPSKIQVGRAYCTCWTDNEGHDRPCPPISFVLHCTHYLCGDVLFVSRVRITLFHCGIFSHNLHKDCSSQIILMRSQGPTARALLHTMVCLPRTSTLTWTIIAGHHGSNMLLLLPQCSITHVISHKRPVLYFRRDHKLSRRWNTI